MKSITKKVLVESSDEQLRAMLGQLNRLINSRSITWENAKGDERSCPFNVFSHTGRVDTSRDVDPVAWDAGCAVLQRAESERRNGGNMVSLKAGFQKKAATTSATVRTTGLRASDTPVLVQLAEAQRLANQARMVSAELFRRAEAEAERLAIEESQAESLESTEGYRDIESALSGGHILPGEASLLLGELKTVNG